MAHAPIGMILSAGFGTRLLPLTHLRPKPVMEFFGQPIVFWLIKMLERAGIKDIFLNLHYQPEKITRALLECDIKARLHFSYEKELLGTAGALNRVLRKFDIDDRKMLLLHGDILCDVDLTRLLAQDDFCALLCARDRIVKGYQGSVAADGLGQIVELGRFYRTGGDFKSRGFFTGIHSLSPEALRLIKNDDRSDLVAQIYPSWLHQGKPIKAIMNDMYYEDLGSKERLFKANMALNESPFYENFLKPKDYLNHVVIHEQAFVDPLAKIRGPLLIGKGSYICKGAEIGPHVIIGKNCLIKESAIIKKSVVISDTIIEKDERLDCTIGVSSARVIVKSC